MSDNKEVKWTGASGATYTYYAWPLPADINAGQEGNYIFVRREGDYYHAVYIGEGDLGARTDLDQHHKGECIQDNGATEVHVHLNWDDDARKAEEEDLLAGNPEAYAPTGCNERVGG